MGKEYKPTKEQQAIIDAPIGNMLVSAAAGSGKTTVLVKRIINSIEAGNIAIDRILVVTFTREAANKMKGDVEKALREEIEKLNGDPSSKAMSDLLKKQLDLLPSSNIQTLDSFCSQVINERSHVLAGMDVHIPEQGTVVLDSDKLDPVLKSAAMEAIKETYLEGGSDEFFELTDRFGNGRTDDDLADDICYVYKKLRSLPDYLRHMDDMLVQRQEAQAEGRILGLQELVNSVTDVTDLIDGDLLTELHALLEKIGGKNKHKDELHDLIDAVEIYVKGIEEAKKTGDLKAVWNSLRDYSCLVEDPGSSTAPVYVGLPKNDPEDEASGEFLDRFGPVAALINLLKPKLFEGRAKNGYKDCGAPFEISKKYAEFFNETDDETLLRLQEKRTESVRAFTELIKKTDRIFATKKRRAHVVDFSDLAHMAKLILEQKEAGDCYRDRFIEIYIDEYQDNSALQDSIIGLMCSEKGNVFRVGDVKQSIYKFRNAEPKLFLDLSKEYQREGSCGELKTLNCNFRSSKEIIDFVNIIFSQIMTGDGAEIDYDDKQKLIHPSEVPEIEFEGDGEPPVLPRVRMPDTSNVKSAEATKETVLEEVIHYMGSGVELSDICILTRKNKMALELSEFLTENGYPAKFADELKIFGDDDIHGLCNTIIALSNELRDDYLAGLLLAGYRISNFTLEEVGKITVFCRTRKYDVSTGNLINRLRVYAAEAPEGDLKKRTSDFLDWYDDVKASFVMTDIAELLDRLYIDTGIVADCEGRRSKLSMFKNWCCDNFLRFGSDIASVARNLEEMKISMGKSGSVSAKTDSEGKIRCTSIHGSKGLQFKCVIVAGLDDKVSDSDSGIVRFHPENGIVFSDLDGEELKVTPSLETLSYDEGRLLEDNAEQMRLLYVALTRPQKMLSVILPVKFGAGDSLNNAYRLLRKQAKDKISRRFWLASKGGIAVQMIAGIMRLSAASGINDIFEQRNEKLVGSVRCPMRFDGFECLPKFFVPEEEGEETEDTDTPDDDVTDVPEDEALETDLALIPEAYDKNGFPVFEEYPYAGTEKIPFKVTVSQIKALKRAEDGKKERTYLPMNLKVKELSDYVDRARGIVNEDPSSVGTFVHKIFRFMDMEALREDPEKFEDLVDELIIDGVIESYNRGIALDYAEGIRNFALSDIGARLVAAEERGEAEYEKPILFSVDLGGGDFSLVQGIIDLVFTEEDGAVVIDYKTDRVGKDMPRDQLETLVREKHSLQVNCYAGALEASGIKVKERYIYLVRYGIFVRIRSGSEVS
ncbi:MAG: UvrD-helicase domain-containing protein [Clostridiales bacterium]|nr:UvrD-helicase domain-containing protein [Clostridiales bacterium]